MNNTEEGLKENEGLVLKYLTETNRPYSAKDIGYNIPQDMGKGVVQRALDSLVEQSKVIVKVYAKQKVYVVRQPDEDGPLGIDELDTIIHKTSEELYESEAEVKKIESELKSIKNSKTIEQLNSEINSINAEIFELKANLGLLSKHQTQISSTSINEIKEKNKHFLEQYRQRKRLCLTMLSDIRDLVNLTQKELYENIGIETDESVQFILPKD